MLRRDACEEANPGCGSDEIRDILKAQWLSETDQAPFLLLEDVGERPYRLDRMWAHLALAGVFDQVRGLALGSFTGCEEAGADYGSAEVLRELAAGTGLPCIAELPVGHGPLNLAVPLGAPVRLDADAGQLHFLAPVVEARGG